MHSRRGLFEAHELAPSETVAKDIVERIDDLFAIDRIARERGCDFAGTQCAAWRILAVSRGFARSNLHLGAVGL